MDINPVPPFWESWERPENTDFTMILRKRFGRGGPASLTISMVALLRRSAITGETATTKMRSLNVIFMGSQWQRP